jgi:iron complex outermembrane receptor protein
MIEHGAIMPPRTRRVGAESSPEVPLCHLVTRTRSTILGVIRGSFSRSKTTMKSKLVLTTAWSTAALALTQPWIAHADQETALEEVVVTAQKREEPLLRVPMAVSALSSNELSQRGISAITDLQFSVPGLTMREDGPGSNTIFLRGIVNQYGGGAVVGQYLDEVPISLTAYDQLDVRVLDLERIEVLKGPQGTLYGQGSVAGTIRYITRKPVLDAYDAGFLLSGGAVDGGDIEGVASGLINIPLIQDKMGLRIAARLQNGGGWQDQPAAGIEDGNDQELTNARVKWLWKLNDRVDVEAMFVHHRNESELGLGYENPDRTVFVAGDPAATLIPKVAKYQIANVNIIADLGFAQLTSATSYIDNDVQYPFAYQCGPDTNCDPYEGNDDRYDTGSLFSQEVRLTSQGEGPLQWTVGAFYQDLEDQLIADYRTFDASSATPYESIFTDRYFSREESEAYAVFSDVSYKFADRVRVGLGGRYFHDKRSQSESCCELLGVPRVDQAAEFDSFDPRAYLSFEVNQNVNLYASVGSGFRSGGFNAPGDEPFEPEDVLTYEVGAKGSFPNSAFTYEVATFYNDYSDMLRRGLLFNGTNFTSQLSNIGDVEIYGIEGGFSFRPVAGLTLSATAAWLDTEVKEIRATDATNIPGDSLDYVPEISYSVNGLYEFNWSANLPGFARIDFSHRDAVSYTDRSSFDVLPQFADEIDLVNARVGMEMRDLTIALFGTNLTNENKWLDPYHQWHNANRTRPRVIGIELSYSFE